MAQKDQLVLEYRPKGHDLNRSARSDLMLPKGGRAYWQVRTLQGAGARVKVVLHFVGSLPEIQSGTTWMVTPVPRSPMDIQRDEFHYLLEVRPQWTANADTIDLNAKGKPIFSKRCQQREKVGTTSVRPAVSALSR